MPFIPLNDWGVSLRKRDTISARNIRGGTITGKEIILAGGTDGVIRSQNYDGVSGWAIFGDGSAYLGGTVVLGADLYSSDWDGGFDLSVGADGGAAAGWLLDWGSGAAQFQTIFAQGGEIGSLDITGNLTLDGTSGVFRTAASGQRIELDSTNINQINFYTGHANEEAPGTISVNTVEPFALYMSSPDPTGVGRSNAFIQLTSDNNAGGVESLITMGADQVDSVDTRIGTITGYPQLQTDRLATAPGYSFIGDLDTGMFWNAADQLGFSVGGSERFTITTRTSTRGAFYFRGTTQATDVIEMYYGGVRRHLINPSSGDLVWYKKDAGTAIISWDEGNDRLDLIQEGWTAASYSNSWVDFGSGFAGAQYYKDPNGVVHIQGLVKSGSAGNATIFTLPAGYRPQERLMFATYVMTGVARLDINSDGTVVMPTGGSTTWSSISCSFATR